MILKLEQFSLNLKIFDVIFKFYNKMNLEDSKNLQLFKKEWNAIYQSKDSKLIMVGNVEGFKMRK